MTHRWSCVWLAMIAVAACNAATASAQSSTAPPGAPAAKSGKAVAKPATPAAGKAAAPATGAKAAPAAPSAPATGKIDPAEQAKRKQILSSARWRRAMFEFNEWLSTQQIFDAKQVEQSKAELAARVAKMNSRELTAMLDDMDAKFKILESEPAQEAGAWLGQYLSILSDKKRDEVVKELPQLGTMTAAQLSQEIAKIQRKRQSMVRAQATFDQARQAQVDATIKANQAAQEAIRADQRTSAVQYSSPYRPPATRDRPFDNVTDPGPQMEFYVSPWGGVGYIFGN